MCHWKRIKDEDNRFYRCDLEIDEVGIPIYMAPRVIRKILSARKNIVPNSMREK